MQLLPETLLSFAVNFAVILMLVRFIYYPRQRSRAYVFTFMAFSTVIFFVMRLLNDSAISLGAGFGLFAIFSILRYRTDTIPIREMTYLLVITAISVINSVLLSTYAYTEFLITDLATLSVLVLTGVLLIELVGAVLLWLLWANRFPGPAGFWLACFHAVAAFTNAGFDLFSGSPLAPNGPPQDVGTLAVIAVLIFLGSIGLPVISDLVQWRRRRRLSLHSRVTLWISAGLIAFGALAFFAGELQADSNFADVSRVDLFFGSIYFSIAARSAGLVLHPAYINLSEANVIVATALMFVGASPAGMGGGITTSVLAVQLLSVWNYARGRKDLRAGRRVIPEEALHKASIVIVASFLVVFTVSWLLLLTQETTFSEALFETVSAFGTVGFSLGLTGKLDFLGQILIMLIMFWGRLGALTIIVALAQPRVPDRVGYPEESILL